MSEAERVGWLCSYVPEEIIMAAGLLPVRVSGGGETVGQADAYLYPNICPFIKSVLAQGLDGQAKDLAGLVFVRSCDGMRRLYDVWETYVPTPFVYMLEVPKNKDGAAVDYFATQLRRLATALGQEFGEKMTDKSLNQAIKAANEARKLIQGIYQNQCSVALPLRGSEVFQLGLDGMRMGKDAFVKKLKEYRPPSGNQVPGKGQNGKARILVTGNVVDRPDLFQLIENGGADVVAADLCTAMRHFNFLVDEDEGDPYLALARSYLNRPGCARMTNLEERLADAMKLAKDYAVDGVVYTSVKFCDQHLSDAPYFAEKLKEAGIPMLFLENDYTWSAVGQLKTRVEAFIEMLDAGRR